MRASIKTVKGGVLAAAGFKAGGFAAGIKKKNRLDMGMILSDEPASAAAVFTTNLVIAAPLVWSKRVAARGTARAVVVNAGNANACTGKAGYRDAVRMAAFTAELLDLKPLDVFVTSTGVIGRKMPMNKIEAGIRGLAGKLECGADAGNTFARSIMTTDTRPKERAVTVSVKGKRFTIGGAAKGSGMIAPNMATMLGFLTTDAAVAPKLLQKMLLRAAENSFNSITVDGHVSTNDMVTILANGRSGVKIAAGSAEAKAFEEGLAEVSKALAKDIVSDGEGATKVLAIRVTGAKTKADAVKVGRAIADSPLVKTAVYGGDPNWGRIVSAVGYAGVPLDMRRVKLSIGGIPIFARGEPLQKSSESLRKAMTRPEVNAVVSLGHGKAEATIWTSDLTQEYVHINADYTT